MISRRGTALALALLLSARAHAELQTWTDSAGRTFRAEFQRMEGPSVIFTMEGGRVLAIPLTNLNATDQARVQAAPPATTGASTPAAANRLNFGYPWPAEIRMDGPPLSKVVSEDAKTSRFVYESPNYRFTCNVRLTPDVLRNFAMMFETTRKYTTSVPLSLDGGILRQGRYDILLFETKEQYIAAGGRGGSAACYIPSMGAVLAPMQSVGLTKTGTGFSLDTAKTSDVLIHELVHQLTPHSYMSNALNNGWFVEGLAEYISSTPYSWGYFRPDPQGNAVLSYVTAYGEDRKGGRALGTKIRVPRLQRFMLMGYEEFAGEKGNLHYGLGLLLTHYFLHMEGGGKSSRITAYLKGIREGQTGQAALAPLLGGSSFEKLEGEFAAAWRRKGIELVFE